jgi:hypothetical protein
MSLGLAGGDGDEEPGRKRGVSPAMVMVGVKEQVEAKSRVSGGLIQSRAPTQATNSEDAKWTPRLHNNETQVQLGHIPTTKGPGSKYPRPQRVARPGYRHAGPQRASHA